MYRFTLSHLLSCIAWTCCYQGSASHLGDTGRYSTFIFTLKENRNPGVLISFIHIDTAILIYKKYYLWIREYSERAQLVSVFLGVCGYKARDIQNLVVCYL